MTIQHVVEGAGAPLAAPPSLGAHYVNTTNGDQYLAKGIASAADWVLQVAGMTKTDADAAYQPKGNYQPAGSYATEQAVADLIARIEALELLHVEPAPTAEAGEIGPFTMVMTAGTHFSGYVGYGVSVGDMQPGYITLDGADNWWNYMRWDATDGLNVAFNDPVAGMTQLRMFIDGGPSFTVPMVNNLYGQLAVADSPFVDGQAYNITFFLKTS